MVKKILAELQALADQKPVSIMEVCGTHTVAVYRSGIAGLLPKNLHLISGPGCPVCVTSESDLYRFFVLSRKKGVIITTFGDLLRVPAGGQVTPSPSPLPQGERVKVRGIKKEIPIQSSLEKERAKGADVRIVYSPMDALAIAEENPGKDVVFLGIGFETTAPAIAGAVLEAKRSGLTNFFLLSALKTIPAAMEALLNFPKVRIDGYLCPGHVSVIIGSRPYRFISEDYHRPAVITGFQPEDILEGLLLILKQIKSGKPKVEIQYRAAVHPKGNEVAQNLIRRVFTAGPASWRGLGVIPKTGLKLKAEFQRFDGQKQFKLPEGEIIKPNPACRCGEVITGAITPENCRQFRRKCTPEKPLGPCMVSVEGTCAAHYKYNA
ncbi:MAG: hydrogenase formation protein HypD [Candidatus Omnitrophota bacterium]|nr:hydrogenase formation protein HypD [Candidatus Omnitrophota bacterium]